MLLHNSSTKKLKTFNNIIVYQYIKEIDIILCNHFKQTHTKTNNYKKYHIHREHQDRWVSVLT